MNQAVRRFHFISVDSTSSEASRLVASGETPPFWVTAEEQRRGRGRRGQAWTSKPGNLYASCVLMHHVTPNVSQLPLVAAVALFDALERLGRNPELPGTGQVSTRSAFDLAIKWPNDVMLDGLKVAGILVESEISGDKVRLILGFGVNCAHHPDHSNHPATHLADHGIMVGPDAVFEALSQTLQNRISDWQWGAGFDTIRDCWLTRAAGLGKHILVRLPQSTIEGRFDGLDSKGHLILNTDTGLQLVSAGDVFLLDTDIRKDRTS